MRRKMESIEVFANQDGTITVKNEVMGSDDYLVTFTTEQADLVCKWIQEVKEELLSEDLKE